MSLRDTEERAEAGSVVAQSLLGCTLVWGGEIDGETLEPDYPRALRYLLQAADAGAVRAVYHLGVLYEDGLGVPEDLERAVALHERAANEGEYYAVLHLARLCADGRLGSSDVARATAWYQRLLELAENLGALDVDDEMELAEARMFIETGTLPESAARSRGCP
jgi:TPR repeat protein